MKVEQLLGLYAQGERNFRGANLQGLILRGRDLSEADFSGANIRGADFSNAILRGVDFCGVRAGVPLLRKIFLFLALPLISGFLGILTGIVGTLVNLKFRTLTTGFEEVTAGWVVLVLLVGFSILWIRKGIVAGFGIFIPAFLLTIAVTFAGPVIVSFVNPLAFAIAGAITIAITIVSSVAALTVAAVLIAAAAAVTFNIAVGGVVAAAFVLAFCFTVASTKIITSIVAVVPSVMLLSAYMNWRALMTSDQKHMSLRMAIEALVVKWGTSFRDADLTDADFTLARLENTDFDGAMLTHTRWSEMDQPLVASSAVD